MKALKKIVKNVIFDDIYTQCFNGFCPDYKYKEAVLMFLQNHEKKQEIIQRIILRLQKKQPFKQTMGTLYFIDSIISSGFKLILAYPNPQKLQTLRNHQKIEIAQQNLKNFYIEYIKILSKRDLFLNINYQQVNQSIEQAKYCIEIIIEFLKVDFIFIYCLQHSKSNQILTTITKQILQRISIDLIYLNKFINKWSYLILENIQLSLDINQIYQKLLFINKQLFKIQKIKRLLKLQLKFIKYQINKQLNSTIQKEVLNKNQIKKEIEKRQKNKTCGYIQPFAIQQQDQPSINYYTQQQKLMTMEDFI